jgi:ribosomal protein S27E
MVSLFFYIHCYSCQNARILFEDRLYTYLQSVCEIFSMGQQIIEIR